MGIFDSIKDRIMGTSGDDYDDEYYDDEYDDYDDEFDGGRSSRRQRRDADSITVYTRSGRPVGDNRDYFEDEHGSDSYDDAPKTDDKVIPFAPSSRDNYGASQASETSSFSVLGRPQTQTPGDRGLTPLPRMSSGKLPPYIFRPSTYDDCEMIIRRVKTSQPVVVSFVNTQGEIAKRVLDFCFGLSCGIDGSCEQLDDKVFVVLPKGITLSEADINKLKQDRIIS